MQIEPSEEKLELVYLSLFSTCFALPLAMKNPRFGSLRKRYVEQLDFILKAYK
ncbi:hypothetical protein MNB_SV-5-1499 [hydrothermal vent metagenome]|uniref:Transcriptional regulator, TetR family n=1 Tax=hydrothermal vent metagenome TaxID=652676 RepID=A0A1W1EDV8_9ZZZZ